MTALAEPGRIVELDDLPAAPAPLGPAASAVLLALADYETPVWLSPSLRAGPQADHIRFHTGASIVADPSRASFAVIGHAHEFDGFEGFPIGSLAYPDRSATVILQVDAVSPAGELRLDGPGIPGHRDLGLSPMPEALAPALVANAALYPRGIDLILAAPQTVVGLPRSTRVRD